jgi:hypothetical protein
MKSSVVLAVTGNLLSFSLRVSCLTGNAEIMPVRLFFPNKLTDFSGNGYQWSTLNVVGYFVSKSNLAKYFYIVFCLRIDSRRKISYICLYVHLWGCNDMHTCR